MVSVSSNASSNLGEDTKRRRSYSRFIRNEMWVTVGEIECCQKSLFENVLSLFKDTLRAG